MQIYQLKSSSSERGKLLQHHVAKLNCQRFDVGQLNSLRLYRGSLNTNPNVDRTEGVAAGDSVDFKPEHSQEHATDMLEDHDGSKVESNSVSKAAENKRKGQWGNKKKTKLYYDIYDQYAAAKHLRKREYLPWLLEDESGDISFVGRLDGSQNSNNYVLFVYENGEFTVLPAARWYKFQSRITYRTLTAEEAEEQMKRKSFTLDKWMMHKKTATDTDTVTESGLVATSYKNTKKGKERGKYGQAADVDELIFDEQFDDDEEYGKDLGEEQSEEQGFDEDLLLKRKGQLRGEDEEDIDEEAYLRTKNSLKDRAKDTKKLLKKMHQDALLPFDTDAEDEEDPYAESDGKTESESLSESENEKDSLSKSHQKSQVLSSSPISALHLQPPRVPSRPLSRTSSRSASPSLVRESTKRKRPLNRDPTERKSREASPAASSFQTENATKKIKVKPTDLSDQNSSDFITKDEVIQIFLNSPNNSTTTEQVIKSLRKKLKKNPNNQSLLIEIVKKIAQKNPESNTWTLK